MSAAAIRGWAERDVLWNYKPVTGGGSNGTTTAGASSNAQRALAGREAAEGFAFFAERMAGGAKDAHGPTGPGAKTGPAATPAR